LAKGLPNRATRIVKELAKYQEKGEVQIAYEADLMGRFIDEKLKDLEKNP
jgi:hypothetical protein